MCLVDLQLKTGALRLCRFQKRINKASSVQHHFKQAFDAIIGAGLIATRQSLFAMGEKVGKSPLATVQREYLGTQ